MEMQQVDARGMECPKPVIATKKALEAIGEGVVVTLVDNTIARDNVVRLAEGLSLPVEVKEASGTYQVTISKGSPFVVGMINDLSPQLTKENEDLALFISSDTFGRGNDDLGQVLMKSFLYTVSTSDVAPRWVIMVNGGVTLACQGSSVLESLREMAKNGSEIVACGTCLDFYGMKDKLAVGRVGNMYEIVDILKRAGNKLTV